MSFLIQTIYPLYPRPYSFLDPLLSLSTLYDVSHMDLFEVIYQCCLVSTFLSFLSLSLRCCVVEPGVGPFLHCSTAFIVVHKAGSYFSK
jgi:hypothetical protein